VVTKNYETRKVTKLIENKTTTIKMSDGSEKVETTKSVAGRQSEQVASQQIDRVLLKEEIITADNSEEQSSEKLTPTSDIQINWRGSEYLFDYAKGVINAEAAYQQGWTGKDVTVAILDSGIDTDHVEFSGKIINSFNPISGTSEVEDTAGHGSHVAGIIAARRDGIGMHGIAFDANILPVKVMNQQLMADFNAIKTGLNYAADHGAKVANLSLGRVSSYNVSTKNTYILDRRFGKSYQDVVDKGLSIIMSAGNNGYNCKEGIATKGANIGHREVLCNFPAALPHVKGYPESETSFSKRPLLRDFE
jgi:subtilisin family serine protease